MIPLLTFATILLAASSPKADACQPGCGFMYDEVHSFSVESPHGWCASLVSHTCKFEPRAKNAAPDHLAASVSMTFLTVANKPYDVFVNDDLKALSGAATSVAKASLKTARGRVVQVWAFSPSGSDDQRLVAYLLQENMCAVRFLISGPANSQEKADVLLRKLVAGYKANI